MNISLQNVDKVSAVLTVQIEKAEYAGISQRHGSDDIAQEAVWYVSIGRGS